MQTYKQALAGAVAATTLFTQAANADPVGDIIQRIIPPIINDIVRPLPYPARPSPYRQPPPYWDSPVYDSAPDGIADDPYPPAPLPTPSAPAYIAPQPSPRPYEAVPPADEQMPAPQEAPATIDDCLGTIETYALAKKGDLPTGRQFYQLRRQEIDTANASGRFGAEFARIRATYNAIAQATRRVDAAKSNICAIPPQDPLTPTLKPLIDDRAGLDSELRMELAAMAEEGRNLIAGGARPAPGTYPRLMPAPTR